MLVSLFQENNILTELQTKKLPLSGIFTMKINGTIS